MEKRHRLHRDIVSQRRLSPPDRSLSSRWIGFPLEKNEPSNTCLARGDFNAWFRVSRLPLRYVRLSIICSKKYRRIYHRNWNNFACSHVGKSNIHAIFVSDGFFILLTFDSLTQLLITLSNWQESEIRKLFQTTMKT